MIIKSIITNAHLSVQTTAFNSPVHIEALSWVVKIAQSLNINMAGIHSLGLLPQSLKLTARPNDYVRSPTKLSDLGKMLGEVVASNHIFNKIDCDVSSPYFPLTSYFIGPIKIKSIQVSITDDIATKAYTGTLAHLFYALQLSPMLVHINLSGILINKTMIDALMAIKSRHGAFCNLTIRHCTIEHQALALLADAFTQNNNPLGFDFSSLQYIKKTQPQGAGVIIDTGDYLSSYAVPDGYALLPAEGVSRHYRDGPMRSAKAPYNHVSTLLSRLFNAHDYHGQAIMRELTTSLSYETHPSCAGIHFSISYQRVNGNLEIFSSALKRFTAQLNNLFSDEPRNHPVIHLEARIPSQNFNDDVLKILVQAQINLMGLSYLNTGCGSEILITFQGSRTRPATQKPALLSSASDPGFTASSSKHASRPSESSPFTGEPAAKRQRR